LAREAAIGAYEAAAEAADRIADVYDAIAALIGAPGRVRVRGKRHGGLGHGVLCGSVPTRRARHHRPAEYLSNYLAFLQIKARVGIEIDVVEDDASGQLDPAALECPNGPWTKLIAIAHVPTEGGLVNPAAEAGRIVARSELPKS